MKLKCNFSFFLNLVLTWLSFVKLKSLCRIEILLQRKLLQRKMIILLNNCFLCNQMKLYNEWKRNYWMRSGAVNCAEKNYSIFPCGDLWMKNAVTHTYLRRIELLETLAEWLRQNCYKLTTIQKVFLLNHCITCLWIE